MPGDLWPGGLDSTTDPVEELLDLTELLEDMEQDPLSTVKVQTSGAFWIISTACLWVTFFIGISATARIRSPDKENGEFNSQE